MSKTPRKLDHTAQQIIWRVKTIGAADPDPHLMLSDSARSVTIIGKMLEALAIQYEVPGKGIGAKIALAGQFLWGIVEISVPNRLANYIGRNWIALIALIGAAIVLLDIVVKVPGMGRVGWLVLAVAFLLRLLVFEFTRWMRTGKSRWRTLLLIAGFLVTLVLFAFAASYIADHAANIIRFRTDPLKYLGLDFSKLLCTGVLWHRGLQVKLRIAWE